MSPRHKQALTIELALLGLLREQSLHGYDLYQHLFAEDALGPIWPLKQSQFYALVTKLEQAGYLTATQEQQRSYPPRRILHLTADGEAAFAAWLASAASHEGDMQRDLLARLYFARRAGSEAVQTLANRQRAASQARQRELQAQMARLSAQQSFTRQVIQVQLWQIEALLGWLDQCVAPRPAELLVTCSIAVIKDSACPDLAQQFVSYVCSPDGQHILQAHGFLAASETRPDMQPDAQPASTAPAQAPVLRGGRVRVFAAASLTEAFQAIGRAFSAVYQHTELQFTFDGSGHLSEKLALGAAADVFAPASHAPMAHAMNAGRVEMGSERIFAYNRLVVVAPRQKQPALASLRDLAAPGLRLVFGSAATAVGQYSIDLLARAEQEGSLSSTDRAAVLRNVISYEETVRDVLTRIECGDGDAGIVFASDCHSSAGPVVSPIIYPTPGPLQWGTS